MSKGEMIGKAVVSGMNALAGITGVMGKNKSEERREGTEMFATTTATVGSVIVAAHSRRSSSGTPANSLKCPTLRGCGSPTAMMLYADDGSPVSLRSNSK